MLEIQLYTKRGWILLEEGQYHVVLEKLLEKQAQQQQQQQDQVNTPFLYSLYVCLPFCHLAAEFSCLTYQMAGVLFAPLMPEHETVQHCI